MISRDLPNEAATIALGEALYASLPADAAGWTLLLSGELGAGKSTFARAVIWAAGHDGAVPSPTYTLVEPYDLAADKIYHIDLYRLSSHEELHFLGWDETEDGLRIVEWPERAPGLLDDSDISIELSYDGDARFAKLLGLSDRGRALIQNIN